MLFIIHVTFITFSDIDTDYKMIFTELKTVDDSLLETGDVLIQGKVYQMLSVKLGIKELNEWDIIDHHIIPQLKSQAHHQVHLRFLINCITCIYVLFSFPLEKG